MSPLKGLWCGKFIRYSNKPRSPIPKEVWTNPLYFFAFGFGSGAAPFAPGTFGTLASILIYILIEPLPLFSYLFFLAIFTVFSIWVSDWVSKKIQVDDHPGMCIDEFVGFLVTMIAAPHGIGWIAYGFILFRIFDIWKPWPINVIDKRVHGGVGMILDDIVAGLFAMIIIQITARLL
jgi:phosphatidylglycerophosphatase A